tara:strand:+ start:462 stop:815 length:354 start_codon:yes stop_codon:yes gene_type:complete
MEAAAARCLVACGVGGGGAVIPVSAVARLSVALPDMHRDILFSVLADIRRYQQGSYIELQVVCQVAHQHTEGAADTAPCHTQLDLTGDERVAKEQLLVSLSAIFPPPMVKGARVLHQ